MAASLPVLESILRGRTAAKCETDALDFKEAKANFKDACNDMAEAAVCFANANGGLIVVGVADAQSGPSAFVGCDLDPAILRSRIHQLTSPSLLVEVEAFEFNNTRLLEIKVPAGLEVYATTRGYTYQRIHTDCVPMRPMDVTRLSEERRGIDWSSIPSGRTVDEIDPIALRYARRLLASSTDLARQRYATLKDSDLLRSLKLVASDGSMNHAGELLRRRTGAAGPDRAADVGVHPAAGPGGRRMDTATGELLLSLRPTTWNGSVCDLSPSSHIVNPQPIHRKFPGTG